MVSARMEQGRSIAALDGGELMELMDCCSAGMMEQGRSIVAVDGGVVMEES
jgi:hypothetical protein